MTATITTLAVLGAPGAGKTTVLREVILTMGQPVGDLRNNLAPDGKHLNYASCLVYPEAQTFLFGIYDGNPYDGTDRFGRNVLPAAIVLIRKIGAMPTFNGWKFLLEGDRLVSKSFLEECALLGPVQLICLQTDPDIVAERSAARTAQHDAAWIAQAGKLVAGKPRRAGRIDGQDKNWAKGRATKVANLCAEYPTLYLPNNTAGDLDVAIRKVMLMVHSNIPMRIAAEFGNPASEFRVRSPDA